MTVQEKNAKLDKRTYAQWVNAVFKIMFKSMFIKVTQA